MQNVLRHVLRANVICGLREPTARAARRDERTLILFSPSILKLCSASFATVELASSTYSTNAMSRFVGMSRTSCRFGYLAAAGQRLGADKGRWGRTG
jgi:hypothetical protein